MSRTSVRRISALALTALILAAHLPLPAAAAASGLACCGPKTCCQPARECTSGGACATHDHATTVPIAPGLQTLLAGNCADPTPRVVPVSYDPVTQTQHVAVRVDATMADLDAAPTTTSPARDTTPFVPPPRA